MRQITLTCLLLLVLLSGCAATPISKIDNKFDHSGSVYLKDEVKSGPNTIHYYFMDYGWRGWYCWEYTCDGRGVVIHRRGYWVGHDRQNLDEFRGKIRRK